MLCVCRSLSVDIKGSEGLRVHWTMCFTQLKGLLCFRECKSPPGSQIPSFKDFDCSLRAFVYWHPTHYVVSSVGDGYRWYEPVESLRPQPLHHFGHLFRSGESGKENTTINQLEPQIGNSDGVSV